MDKQRGVTSAHAGILSLKSVCPGREALDALRSLRSVNFHDPFATARGVASIQDGALAGGILITLHRLSHGGADRVAIYLANGFCRAGVPVGLATLRSGGEGEATLLGLLDKRVLLMNAGRPMGSRHLELIRGVRYLRSIVQLARPSVVLASSNNMGLVTGLAAVRRSAASSTSYVLKTTNPVIRPFDQRPLRKFYRRKLYGFVFSKFDRILTLSVQEHDRLSHMYPQERCKLSVVENPYISSDMLKPSRQLRPLGAPRILTLARMMPQKRLDILIQAFAKLQRDDCRLTILGDGPERPKLRKLARALGVADRIDMPGFTEEVVPHLKQAHLFALSSEYEGWPAAVFEALASNLPVVSTDCFDGARALLAAAPRCAVVPLGDVGALARAMELSLASSGDVTGLREMAACYEIEAGVTSHVRAVRPLLQPRSFA